MADTAESLPLLERILPFFVLNGVNPAVFQWTRIIPLVFPRRYQVINFMALGKPMKNDFWGAIMEHFLTTMPRTLLGFTVLFVLTRVLGKKQLSQMTFFTYITGIALGNIAGDMVVHRDINLIDGVIGLTLWAFLTLTVEYISLKSPKARIVLDGEPTIIIKKGNIIEEAMKSNKLNMDDLTMLLRLKNIFSIAEVDYAILEPNGQLSVLKKMEYENASKKDAGIAVSPRRYLPAELIVDGRVVKKNLLEFDLTEGWLLNELKLKGISRLEDVLYAELQSDGTTSIKLRY